MRIHRYILSLLIMSYACQSPDNKNEKSGSENADAATKQYEKGTFGYDLNFLKSRDSVFVLEDQSGEGMVIVSPKYQAKVFTSTANGLEGSSFGWVNYEAFGGETDPHMNAYGGENRIWLGPEGGKYSVFFAPGTAMEFKNWVTPAPIDTESWEVLSGNNNSVTLQKNASFLNYSGTSLETSLRREIEILEKGAIEDMLGIEITDSVLTVGFKTVNTITNIGEKEWNKETGAPCIWILDMFNVTPATVIVIPFHTNTNAKIATTDYFGEIPADRIAYKDSILLFRADGKSRGKLGITPERAKPVAGSYDAENGVLTITTFDVDNDATYLNQEWSTEKDPLQGDAVNAYNDGPLADGTQMGPFYEIESVSPAAFLQPGESLTHRHNVFHFTGEEKSINEISENVLGISLENITSTFQ